MLFYFSYKAFFVQDTFLKTKRVYLKFSFLFSLYLPLINFTHWFEGKQITQTLMANNILLPDLYVVAPKSSFSWDVETVFLMLYFAVCAVFLIRFFIQLFAIIQMRRKGKVTILFNTKVIVLHDEIAPFSFLNWIFVNPELHTERELKEILTHELAHVKQVHSGDVFLSELLIMCFWINPVAWLLRREIRQNLEFLADNKVLESGFDSKSYQYHLLQLSYQSPDFKLSNKFNVSPLKKRITMMNQQKTKKAGVLKYSLIVPLAIGLVLTSNAETILSTAKKTVSTRNDSVLKEMKNVSKNPVVSGKLINCDEVVKPDIYQVVEKMPQYPGGEKALMEYIAGNLKYPADAMKNNEQGRLIIRFVVNKLGKVEKAEVLRGLTPSMNAEAMRVVNAMQDWIPGEQKGQKVSVYYTLPITFRLQGNSKPSAIMPTGKRVFVLDGKTMPKDFDISAVKPESIASVDVIKPDTEIKKADLIAKYGADAANGVILISTKK